MQKRPPIVVVMGHVDHGKTSLLDYIKKTTIAAREAGGITQSIGAYEITHQSSNTKQSEKITFIDTPGHEAFSKMRTRGGQAADIAILVIAADEGLKPQTKESLEIIKKSEIPFIIAFTKIDKNNSDISRVKSQLSQEGILLEGEGGNISWQGVSAVTGEGVEKLLDLILLVAEFEQLTFDASTPGAGFIIESHLDSRRGVVVAGIVQKGTLKVGDEIVVGSQKAKIKGLENFLGEKIIQAQPSMPVIILGFSQVPEVGLNFMVGGELVVAKEKIAVASEPEPIGNQEKNTINLIIKSKDSGSLEVLSDIIKNLPLPENFQTHIITTSIGDITDGDVKMAISTQSRIIGFKVKVNRAAENLARDQKIKITTSEIVYELIKQLNDWIASMQRENVLGDLEVLMVFGKKSGNKYIIGGRVAEGFIINNSNCFIVRQHNEVGRGKIINLQKNKIDSNRVDADNECGLLVVSDIEIRNGDHVIIKE